MTKTLSDKIILMILTLLFTAGEVFASGSFEIGIPTVVPVISAALVYGGPGHFRSACLRPERGLEQ